MVSTKSGRGRGRGPRVAARALIRRGDRILTVRMRDANGTFHVLPGGGQRHGETLTTTVTRECREELGCDVEVGELFYVREYIGRNHDFSVHHRDFHQIELVFHADLAGKLCLENATEQDRKQVGIEWIHVRDLKASRFLPEALIPILFDDTVANRYLGDVN